MIREFEGKTEKEAIDKAIESLGLNRDEIDIEIVEAKKALLFGKGKVRIKVHVGDEQDESAPEGGGGEDELDERPPMQKLDLTPEGEAEPKMLEFLQGVIERMGYSCRLTLSGREKDRIVIDIASEAGGMIIGRKGKNLDALQVLCNVYAGRIAGRHYKVVLDAEDYRSRREKSLMELAKRTGEQVRRSRGSKLLEAMNPFERRVIHTTLSGMRDVATISEGEGLYKKVRVFYREPGES
jgi:spoIIIJ-associated protein